MKSGAEKSSTSSKPAHSTSSQPFFAKQGEGGFFSPSVQFKLTVNQPGDKHEQEADKMAEKVMRMPAPPSAGKEEKLQRQPEEKLQKKEEEKIQKAAAPEEKIQKAAAPEEKIQKAAAPEEKIQKAGAPEEKLQKKEEEKIQKAADEKLQRDGTGAPAVASNTQSAIQGKTSGGQPLSNDVRGFMEPRFGADFSNVRVHTDAESAGISNQLSARAFTYQNHIFFSRDQYQPGSSEGKQLLAHELTHTIQQGHAVQRSPQVSTTASTPAIQRSAVGEILDWIADKANYIPGFRMFTIILGMNPVNMRSVDRSAANILRAIIEFMPGATLITQTLDNHGVFTKVADWAEKQIKTLGMVGSMFGSALSKFIDSLGLSDLAPWNWGSVWDRAKAIFTAPIGRLISFVGGLVTDILKFVKDAILKPLAAMAEGTRGYDLLKALLGEDPITGEPVPRTADTLIGGFMKLIGQEEIWENIKKGNAVGRAWAWFQGALSGLLGFARSIPTRIVATIRSLSFTDIVTVAGAFIKIVGTFANIAGEFFSWAFNQVVSLLEILFSVVAPGVMPYIKKAQTAFVTIIKDPIGFVGNLVRAGKRGFELFAGNIIQHLKAALIKWLVGPLADAGVYIPQSFSLIEIIKLVLSVLGLTWQNIRSKLVKIIPEPVLVGLEKTAGILVTLVKDGPAAAWEQIKTELTELKDQLISQVIQMVSTEVVKAAVMKLVSMLSPAGAVIQAIIAIYNTISFFIEKAKQIAAVVAAFIDSVSAIAAGQVENAAKKVEQTMANTLVVVIGFLAKFAGLGGIPNKLVGIVKKVRQPIDKGLDKIVAWLGNMLSKAKAAVTEWWKAKKPFSTKGGQNHEVFFTGDEKNAVAMVASKDPKPVEHRLAEFRRLAGEPTATANQKASLGKIDQTQKALKKDPNDPVIVTNLRDLFGLFDDVSPTRAVDYKQAGKDLPGAPAGNTVGTYMSIDWLSTDFIASHHGSPPGSGQNKLMDQLVVDPKNRSAFKYIRGHLLNENLGGKGENINLFPITANANSQHLRSTESELKNWVLATPPESATKQYALYEVSVAIDGVRLSNTNIAQNYVNSTFNTRVVLKDDAGAEKKSFMASIKSEYTVKDTAKRFDMT